MRVKATQRCFVGNTLREENEVFEHPDGADGTVLVPVDEEPAQSERRASRSPKPRSE